MKKLLSLLVIALLAFTVVGCSSAPASDDEGGDTTSTTINVYTRDSSSGTREAFEGAIGFDEDAGDTLTATASEVSSNGDMATRVGQDANGIGYVSLTTDFEANNIKPLQFEGVEASSETVLDVSYKMQRPFNFVTRASGDFVSDDMEQLVAAFIAYITESQEGLAVVEEAGGIVDYTNARPWAEIAAEYPVLEQDNSSLTIRTGGSTSVEKCINAALTAFQPLAGNVQFAMNQTGSGDGYKRVLGEEKDGANAVEIGFASRPFEDEEDVTTAMASGSFCLDAVVAVVNADNALENITAAELKDIYLGNTTDFGSLAQQLYVDRQETCKAQQVVR